MVLDHSPEAALSQAGLSEAFALGSRVLVLDRARLDPHEPGRFGATVTYDIPVTPRGEPAIPVPLYANKWRKSA